MGRMGERQRSARNAQLSTIKILRQYQYQEEYTLDNPAEGIIIYLFLPLVHFFQIDVMLDYYGPFCRY